MRAALLPYSVQLGIFSSAWNLASWTTRWHDYVPATTHPPTHHPWYNLIFWIYFLIVLGRCLECILGKWMVSKGVWKVCGKCVEGAWEMSRRYLEGAWKVSGRYLEGVWNLSWSCPEHYATLVPNSTWILLGQVRTAQVRKGQVMTGQFRNSQVRTGQVRTGQVRTGQVGTGQVRTGQVRTGQIRTGQVRTGQVRTCQVRTGKVCSCPVNSGQDRSSQDRDQFFLSHKVGWVIWSSWSPDDYTRVFGVQ